MRPSNKKKKMSETNDSGVTVAPYGTRFKRKRRLTRFNGIVVEKTHTGKCLKQTMHFLYYEDETDSDFCLNYQNAPGCNLCIRVVS